ncbi:MAG: hypothetical protein OM95_02370 [Bdellovibrio sp. ArHS]|uniref:ABC transporter permease subunit n=1 Tax=Bdellovibrio sp. ArHS TaxID=1569284 RepID=UPI000582482C|nr:ABC transporter permease subunit [Bdellovibrio sp. ArHS]KHD89597.1 MAG: hypothetical protein OM95_02370 [Bdellovibrio sp. ArHS]
MRKFKTLFKYESLALAQSRWLWIYLAAFNLILFALRYFSNEPQQLFVSTMNSILFFHSIGLLLFATLSWQNNSEFISLILTQPIQRKTVFIARFLAFGLSLALFTDASLLLQMGASLSPEENLRLLVSQTVVEIIFTGLGFLLAIQIQDRLKAMAVAAGLVLLFCLVLDSVSLWIIINYASYPLEKIILGLSALNPLTLLKFQNLAHDENSLWIGYAGLLLQRAWDSGFIQTLCGLALSLWIVLPVSAAWVRFKYKDF